jgi:hypothetical protein
MMVPACNWKPEVGGLQVQEFELSPGYIARPSLKKKKKSAERNFHTELG